MFKLGEMVYRKGLGPPPCISSRVTFTTAVDAISFLLKPETVARSKAIAELMSKEDGARNAITAFHKHPPIQSMVCHISLFTDATELAEFYCQECDFRMSERVHKVVHANPGRRHHRVVCISENHDL